MAISRGNWLAGTREMGPTSRFEFVSDVEFVEESGDEAARPPETVGTIGEFL